MKKIIPILSLSLVFLVGCNVTNPSSVSSSSQSTTGNTTSSIINNEKLYLGEYGDYVVSTNNMDTASAYEALLEKENRAIDDLIISSNPKGLLDFFDIENKVKLTISMTEEELRKIDHDYDIGNKETYRMCNVDIEFANMLFHYEKVGIRQKGNTSRGHIYNEDKINLRHYKLKFCEKFDDEYRGDVIELSENEIEYLDERTFFGMEKLNIRWNRNGDATYLKEYYAYETYRNNGLLAPHSNLMSVNFNIDGDNQNFGVYLAVEDIDKTFLKRNLHEDEKGGDLYKLGWNYQTGAAFNNADASLFGVESQEKDGDRYYQVTYPYDLKTNKKKSTHEDALNFVSKIVSTNVTNMDEMLKEETVYDYLVKYFAISYLVGDPDDLRANNNNTYLYFTESGKAMFIPTDHDRALGSTGGSNPTGNFGTLLNPDAFKTGYGDGYNGLFNKTISSKANEVVYNDYVEQIKAVLNNGFAYKNFENCFLKAFENYKDDLVLGDKVINDDIAFSLYENNSINENWNLTASVYFEKKIETFNKYLNGDSSDDKEYIPTSDTFFLRSTFNGWEYKEEYALKEVDGRLCIEIYLPAYCEFKIATSNWSSEYNYSSLVDQNGFLSGDSNNVKVLVAGTYVITIIDEENISVVKK